jgi:hypothetical protein
MSVQVATESSVDPVKEAASRDAARRKWLAEDAAHRQAAMAEFVLSVAQAAATLQRCLETARALGWSRPASPMADAMAGIIEREFRKQFGRELFEQSTNP